MSPEDLNRLADVAEQAARRGGALVVDAFGRRGRAAGAVEAKAPGDYVTELDRTSEEVIREALAAGAPDVAFFGEERGGRRAEVGWLVDPLDGTANFLHAFPVVGISIALVESGVPVVGVVHAPVLGDTWRATAGGGVRLNGESASVSPRAPEEGICATGFPFKAKERFETYRPVFEGAFDAFEDLRRAGAAALDLAWVASGVFDGFFELGLGPWDVAAGGLLIREAGGVVTDWDGDEQTWLESGDVVAGPPEGHERLLDLTRAAVAR